MIICPVCSAKLEARAEAFKCSSCNFSVPEINSVRVFIREGSIASGDYKPEGLDIIHEHESSHFWFRSRLEFILSLFEKHVALNEKIMEIGAGTGNIASALMHKEYDIAVGELHMNGLDYAGKRGIKKLYQLDVSHMPFREHFDAVGMFDVLEHIDDGSLALKNIHASLKTGGRLICTVPAHQWLWSKLDETAGHKRRYSLREITGLIKRNGFDVLEAKNFFVLILPLLYIRKLMYAWKKPSLNTNDITAEFRIHPIINRILYSLCRLENALFKKWSPSVGGSIAIVARKRDDPF